MYYDSGRTGSTGSSAPQPGRSLCIVIALGTHAIHASLVLFCMFCSGGRIGRRAHGYPGWVSAMAFTLYVLPDQTPMGGKSQNTGILAQDGP